MARDFFFGGIRTKFIGSLGKKIICSWKKKKIVSDRDETNQTNTVFLCVKLFIDKFWCSVHRRIFFHVATNQSNSKLYGVTCIAN